MFVNGQEIFDRVGVLHANAVEGFGDGFGDGGVGDLAAQESFDGDFVGGVESTAGAAAGADGLVGEAEKRELVVVGGGEIPVVGLAPVDLGDGGVGAFRIGERVLDGHAHVGGADLGDDAAVVVFNHGVDFGLGMDDDVDFVRREVEEPAGFDDLEAFVH